MKFTTANLSANTAKPGRRVKAYLLLIAGALNVAGGALMVAAPHLQTVLTPLAFAKVMIATGVLTATLAFVTTQLKSGEE